MSVKTRIWTRVPGFNRSVGSADQIAGNPEARPRIVLCRPGRTRRQRRPDRAAFFTAGVVDYKSDLHRRAGAVLEFAW